MPNHRRRGLLERLGLRREALPAPRKGGWAIIPSTAPDVTPIDTPREQLASAVGWVAAAATLISEDVRAAPWAVWRQTGRKREDWIEAPTHAAALAIARPNPTQTLADVLELTDLHFSLTGNWFWHLIRNRPGGRALGMEVIYPQWVNEPVFADGRHSGWRVTVPGHAPRILPVEDVVWGRRPHPADPWRALSQVEAAAASHWADLYTRAYSYSVMRNDGGIPAGIISSDQELTPDQADAIQERWRQRYSQSHGEVAVFGAGSKWQSIGIPMQDLKFLEMGDFNREQILAMFRVPPAVMGQSKDFNRANSEAAMVAYQRQALRPRLRRYEDALNRYVLPALGGEGLYLEFEDPVDKDRTTEQQLALNDLKAGVITVNQYLESVGRDPQASGDVFMVPSGVSIKETLEPQPPPPALQPGPPGQEPPEDEPDEEPEEAEEPERSLLNATEKLELLALRAKARRLEVEAAREKWYRAFRAQVARWMSAARAQGYPDEWKPPPDELPSVPLPARGGMGVIEYLEHLKGPGGKELACVAVPD